METARNNAQSTGGRWSVPCLKSLPSLGQSWAGNVGRGKEECAGLASQGGGRQRRKRKESKKIGGDREKKMGVVKRSVGELKKEKGK